MHNRRDFILAGVAAVSTLALGPAPALAADTSRAGQFKGASQHVARGRAALVQQGGRAQVVLLDDFWFDGAPDPKVALGRNGFDKRTLMGSLRQNAGKQAYAVPAGVDASQYDEVWIWCEKFNVPLGVAKLN